MSTPTRALVRKSLPPQPKTTTTPACALTDKQKNDLTQRNDLPLRRQVVPNTAGFN